MKLDVGFAENPSEGAGDMSVRNAARISDTSPDWIRALCRNGTLKATTDGTGRYEIDDASFREWNESRNESRSGKAVAAAV